MSTVWTEKETPAFIDLLVEEAFKGNIHYSNENEEAFERIIPQLEARTGKKFTLRQLYQKFIALHYRDYLWEKAKNCRSVRWVQKENGLVSNEETSKTLLKSTVNSKWGRMYRHEGERYWWEFSVMFASKFPLDELKVLPLQLPPIVFGEPSVVPDLRERENEVESINKRRRTD